MPQICGHSRTLAFTQVAHAFGAHSQSHGTLLPRRSAAHRGRAWSPLGTWRCQFHLPNSGTPWCTQKPDARNGRKKTAIPQDSHRCPPPQKKMSKTCSISCLCNHVFAVAYHVASRHFGSGRHIAETLEKFRGSSALRYLQLYGVVKRGERSINLYVLGTLVIQLKLLQFVFLK